MCVCLSVVSAKKLTCHKVSGENLGLEVLGISLISLDRVRDFARQAGIY